jgi:cold shock CspA family protein
MTRKKQGPPKRWRSKAAREIAAAVEKVGGAVELTGKGHLRITGPLGVAIVASDPGTGHQGGRALANTWATIERETGLQVAPAAAGKPATTEKAPAAARPPGPPHKGRQDRRGEITRWNRGETYGFITSTEGHSWFVSRDSLPGGLLELPEGTQVTFSGSPKPKIGKPYPEALRVRVTAE